MQLPMLNAAFRVFFWGGALFLALSGCASKSQRANEAFARAQQYVADGQTAEAKRELYRAVGISDDVPEIWVALGQMQLAEGKMPDAFTAFNRADELRPGNADILRPLAYTGYMIGATRIAQDATDRLLVLVPDDGQGLAVKGLLALDKGETATTLEAAESILRSSPNDDTGMLLKARAMAIGGKTEDAIKLLQDAAKQRGKDVTSFNYALLQFYRARGDVAGMQAVFPAIVAGQKDNLELALDYANFLYRTGKTDEARKVWSDTVVASPKDGRFVAWAFELYDNQERYDQPVALDARLTKFGGSPLRTAAGQFLITRKEYARAAALLSEGKGAADTDRGLYAVALEGMGKHAEAQALVKAILGVTNARQDPNALMLNARWALASKSFDRANADAQNAIVADPSNLAARIVLADSYALQDQPLRVRQVWAQAVAAMPRSRRALSGYLQFLESIGDKDSALAAMRSYANANLSDPWGWALLTNTCQKFNDAACVIAARKRYDIAQRDFTFTNPSRPFKMRGLFSPLPAAT